jgi:ornithine decarboxylase
MEYARRFKFLVCARNFDDTDLEGARLRDILAEIEALGYSILRAGRDDDAELVIRTDAAIGCVIVDWGDGAFRADQLRSYRWSASAA